MKPVEHEHGMWETDDHYGQIQLVNVAANGDYLLVNSWTKS